MSPGALPRRRSVEALDAGVPPAEAERSLRDMEWIHRRLGGRAAIRRGLLPALRDLGLPRLTLLDAGCGTGHAGADLAQALAREGVRVDLVGLDRQVSHAALAPRSRTVAGDALAIPLSDRSVDVVFSSLFLHHFADEEVAGLLRESSRVARRLVAHFDVGRHRAALLLVSALGPLVFDSRHSLADGKASVKQAFTVPEVEALARSALPGASAERVGLLGWRLLWRRP